MLAGAKGNQGVKITLTRFQYLRYSWMNFDWLIIPILVILPRKQYKIVGCSSLELFVGNGFEVLGVVLTYTWVVPANNNIPRLLHVRLIRSRIMLRVLDLYRVRQLVSTSSWHTIFILSKSLNIGSKRPIVPWFIFALDGGFGMVSSVLLGTWHVMHHWV
jgi:hypothetical protein